MFWTVYEILLNIYQGALFTWFITKMLPKKKPEYLSSLACSLLTATALSLYLFLSLPEWDTWIFIFVILYALFFFDGSILQKMFWCSIMIIISMGIIGIYYEFFSIVTGADTEKLLSTGSIRFGRPDTPAPKRRRRPGPWPPSDDSRLRSGRGGT